MDTESSTIECTGEELFYLSGLVGGDLLVGVTDPFVGWLAEEVDEALEKARSQLAARGYVQQQSNSQVMIQPAVHPLVDTLSFPTSTFVLTVTLADGYTEQRTFHLKNQLALRLISRESSYRLVPLANAESVYRQVLAIWGIAEQAAAPGVPASLPEATLLEARPLAAEHRQAAVTALQQAGASAAAAQALSATLASPRRNGALVALRREEIAWKTAGIGMLEGDNGLWRLRAFERQNTPWIEAIPCDGPTLAQEIRQLMGRFTALA